MPGGEDVLSQAALRFNVLWKQCKKGDMDTANDVFDDGNDKLKEYCGKYLVSLGKSELVRLVNGARDDIKAWMLRMILVYADQALFDEVFAETKPTDDILSDVAYNADLACKTDKFLYLLGKITDKGISRTGC